MPYYISPPPANPLSRLLAGILAVLALVGAFFFGLFVLAFAAGVGLIAWFALWLRMWWIGKKRFRTGAVTGSADGAERKTGAPSRDRKGEVIDAEYTVVSRQDED